jgi:hypothetical protein
MSSPAYYECSMNYHRMKILEFEEFSGGVEKGYYRPGGSFTAPVIPKAQFQALRSAFWQSHTAYKNQGKLYKAEHLIAKKNLIEALDEIKNDVDEVASGVDTIVMEGGFKPRKAIRAKKNKPGTPIFEYVKHGATCEILALCKKVEGAESYTCIISEGVSAKGAIRVEGTVIIIPKEFTNVYISESQGRKKSFINLKQRETYYVYFFARNAAGISSLSEERSIICV